MGSRGRRQHGTVKIERVAEPSSTVGFNMLPSGKAALLNEPQRSMVSQPRSAVSTKTDNPRWFNSTRFDYLEPLVLPLGIVAELELVIIFLLLVVP